MRALFLVMALSFSAYGSPSEDTRFEQCAVDLCGSAQQYNAITANGPFKHLYPKSSKDFLAKVRPDLEGILNNTLERSLKLNRNLSKLLHRVQIEDLPPAQRAILNINVAFLALNAKEASENAIEIKENRYYINADKLIPILPELTEQEVRRLADLINKFISTGAKEENDYFVDTPLDLYVQWYEQAYGLDAKYRVKNLMLILKDFNQTAKDLINRIGTAGFHDRDLELLSLDEKDLMDLNASEKKRLMLVFARITTLWNALKNGVYDLALGLNIPYSKISSLIKIHQLPVNQPAPEQKEKAIQSCNSALNQALAAAPSPLRMMKALELVEKVRSAAQGVSKKHFSGRALENVTEILKRTSFIKPEDQNQVMNSKANQIKYQLRKSESNLAKTEEIVSGGFGWPVALGFYLTDLSGPKNVDLFSDFQFFCEELAPSTFEDGAYYGQNKILLGWQTLMFPEVGVGIVAHEFGHIVESGVKADRNATPNSFYNKVAEWSNRIHKSSTQDHYLKEDWADLFSVEILKELHQNSSNIKNYACAFNTIKEEKTFSNLALLNNEREDSHSTNLLRSLMIHSALGRPLPQSCKAQLQNEFGNDSLNLPAP